MANATKEEMPEVVAIFMVQLPRMLWSLFTSYLRMKKQAKIAGERFYQALLDKGMPPSMARELTNDYCSAFNITTLLRSRGSEK
jgi:hypothetical protein